MKSSNGTIPRRSNLSTKAAAAGRGGGCARGDRAQGREAPGAAAQDDEVHRACRHLRPAAEGRVRAGGEPKLDLTPS